MTGLFRSSSDLQQLGPTVEATLGVPLALQRQMLESGQPVPDGIPITALIDTGASNTCLRTGLASQLGLAPTGVGHMHTASAANVECYSYAVRLDLGGSVQMDPWVVQEAALAGQDIDALIGRDLLMHTVLTYAGPMQSWTLTL